MEKPALLIPLDGSKLAESSLYYLPALSRLGEFEVELVHVEDSESQERPPTEWDADAYLADAAARAQAISGLTVTARKLSGVPFATILAESENPWISTILITTHGLSGYQRWRIGSVADKVLRGAPCPVLTIGPAVRGAPPTFTRILVPLDVSKLAEEALPVAKLLAERLQTEVRLVSAVTPREVPDELAGSVTADVLESYELMTSEYLDEAALEMETSRPVQTAWAAGPAVDVILAQAEEASCDLIVMTSHGRHGFVRFALGSVADRIVALSPAPVLVVKPGQWQRFSRFTGEP